MAEIPTPLIEIPLTQGKISLIDDEDHDRVSQFKWFYHSQGYAATHGGQTLMHRYIMQAKIGEEVDHINRNRLDNRRSNLRIATAGQQRANSPKRAFITNTSKYKGVCKSTYGKWRAQIKKDGVYYYLGEYSMEEEAARIYDKKAKELFGDFAHQNFPE